MLWHSLEPNMINGLEHLLRLGSNISIPLLDLFNAHFIFVGDSHKVLGQKIVMSYRLAVTGASDFCKQILAREKRVPSLDTSKQDTIYKHER